MLTLICVLHLWIYFVIKKCKERPAKSNFWRKNCTMSLSAKSLWLRAVLVNFKFSENVAFSIVATRKIPGAEDCRAGNSLICSFRSNQMSDCERFAQIAQDKWATMSESLRSLISKDWLWANCSGRSWQMSDREQFAQVTHDKWANEQFTQKSLAKI